MLPLSLDLELFRWVSQHKVKELCSELGLQPETSGLKYQLCLSGESDLRVTEGEMNPWSALEVASSSRLSNLILTCLVVSISSMFVIYAVAHLSMTILSSILA